MIRLTISPAQSLIKMNLRRRHTPRYRPARAIHLASIGIAALTVATIALGGCSKSSSRSRAEQFLKAGMYEEAIPVLQMYIESSPTDPKGHLLMAQAYLGTTEDEQAGEEFQRAKLLDPDVVGRIGTVYYDVAATDLSRSDRRSLNRAAELLMAAVDHDPDLTDDAARLLHERGESLASDDRDLAHQLLLLAVKLNSNLGKDEDTAFTIASTEGAADRRKSALEAYVAGFPKSPRAPAALLELAKLYYNDGDLDGAEKRLTFIRERSPDSPEAGEAQRILEDIGRHRDEAQRIESERRAQEVAAQEEADQLQRDMALKEAKLRAEAEKEQQEAELKQKQLAEERRLEAERTRVELQKSSHSDFDTGLLDGWSGHQTAVANPGSGGNGGGLSNGCLAVTEDKSGPTGYFVAPAAYRGDWRDVVELRMDLKSSGGTYFNSGHGMTGDLVIYNGRMYAWRNLPDRPPASWKRYVVPLREDGLWQYGGGAAHLQDVLGNVTGFWIRAEYGVGTDACALDNVSLFWGR